MHKSDKLPQPEKGQPNRKPEKGSKKIIPEKKPKDQKYYEKEDRLRQEERPPREKVPTKKQ